MIQKVKPSWHFIQIADASMKQASDYPKLAFGYKPRRAYFLNLTRFAYHSQDFVPNPTLRQRGRVRELLRNRNIKTLLILKKENKMFNIEEIDLNEIIENINYMLEVVYAQTGASPSTANFLLSVIGKQNFDINRFNQKVDSRIHDTAMVIMYLLRYEYLAIIEILEQAVKQNQKLLVDVSKKDGL